MTQNQLRSTGIWGQILENIGILFLQTHVTLQNYCNIANSETAEVSAAKLWSVADFSSSRHNESWSGATARSSILTPAWMAAQIKPQHTQTASSC